MAGIGFELKRLTNKDDLLGIARAYMHATWASTGPWLFAVLALGSISVLYSNYFTVSQLIDFRIVVVYNFGFSLVLASPIYMVVTRYLADCVHRKDVTHVPTILLRSLLLQFVILVPFALYYYGHYTIMTLGMRMTAMANLFLITPVWLLGVFLTALKDYKSVSRAFAIGMILAIIFSTWFKYDYGATGMLNGFNIGLTWIGFSLAGKILAEYPYKLIRHTDLRQYFMKYWELAVGGCLYNAAIWADKWLMWMYAPEAVKLPSKMVYFPNYDSAMFLAYLTIVPAMAIFIFSIETNFFLRYQRFYYDILEHKPLATIRENHRNVITTLFNSSRNFFVIQGAITLVCILIAAKIFEIFHINYLQIGIFRLGVLGAFFHVLMLFELIILSYFDCRKVTLWLQGIFLLTNSVFTLVTIHMGFPFYGYGYFLSALFTFALTTLALFSHLNKLPYHAFITNNNSLKPVWKKLQKEEVVA